MTPAPLALSISPLKSTARAMKSARGPLALVMIMLALLTLACDVQAERFALLVGVSRYAAFVDDERMLLSGPRNDVPMLRSLLEREGFAPRAVQVLADGVPDAGPPTRDAILGALDRLITRIEPADFVFLYFAGHGSQMPADAATPEGRAESDGLHEIFLPADVGRWNGRTGRVDNAIADHELVSRLDSLLAKGAFVWAVFDTCHAATMMRSVADPEIRQRRVDPLSLGVPQAALDAAATRARDARATQLAAGTSPEVPGLARVKGLRARSGSPEPGGFVAFYAAQTHQATPEMRLPAGHPDRKSHGLFTYTLAEALSSASGTSYRQLAQYILGRYGAQNVLTPTPLFTGTQLDAPVFGSRVEHKVRQWPIQVTGAGVTLRAGLLDQLYVGAELDILPGPLTQPASRLGTMRVAQADVSNALLAPVDRPDAAAVDVARLPDEAVARLVRTARANFQLRVAAPPPAGDADARLVRQAIETIQRESRDGIDVLWVRPGEAHDLRLWVEDGQLWLLPPSGQWYRAGAHNTHSLQVWRPELDVRLNDSLQHIGRTLNLLRIASDMQAVPASHPLQVQATLRPAAGLQRVLDPLQAVQARDGDIVELKVRNNGRVALDLTALYIDAGYGISALYPYPRGSSNRIEPGDSDNVVARIDATTTGHERLMLIAVEARAQGEHHDFSFLEQPRLDRARTGAGADAITRMFEEAGFGGDPLTVHRGVKSASSAERVELRVYTLNVQ
jgi:hypothetical protein